MKRSSIGTLALAAVAAAAIVPQLGTAHPSASTRVITFQEPRPNVAIDDIAPKSKSTSTLSLGDRLAIGGDLENSSHHHLGTFGGSCVAIGHGSSFVTTPLLCQAVYQTAQGQIEATGMMTLSKTNLVIIGGSGAYTGVHGTITPGKLAKGFDDADKLTITR